MIDDRTLRLLEFPRLLDRVARHAASTVGAEYVRALRPDHRRDRAVEQQRLLAEARRYLSAHGAPDLAGADDIRPPVEKASRGGVLDGLELRSIWTTLQAARGVRGGISRLAPTYPLLAELASRMPDLSELQRPLGAALSPRGEVMDSASPALAAIRREHRIEHERLVRRMDELSAEFQARGAVQEPLVTQRSGRYVLPVKAEARGSVRGIVHDVSGSGATIFVEPLAAVDLGNRVRELEALEEHEVERVLRALSERVAGEAERLQSTIDLLATFDQYFAAARYADELGGCDLPSEGPGQAWLTVAPGELRLLEARHPLLPGEVVPVSLWVGGTHRVLLITGPNTGGKTVSLKTAGLLSCMALAGLPVPAAMGSTVPVFDHIAADIGDEQSIEQSLSTFSSHVSAIVAILRDAGPRSLVLLDELAAGTDPEEGAALGRAIVEELLERGTTTVCTTHHGALKTFAQVTPGVANASVEFDEATLSPTYRLVIGLPGRSNAIAIARRLGMQGPVLERASAYVSPEQVRLEGLLAEAQQERRRLRELRDREEKAVGEAEGIREQLGRRLTEVEGQRLAAYAEATAELQSELSELREAIGRAQRALQRPTIEAVAAAAPVVAEATQRVAALRRRRRARRAHVPALPAEQILPGDRVWLRGLSEPGEAMSAPDEQGELEVALGALRTRVRVEQVERFQRGGVAGTEVHVIPLPHHAAMEIEVRGQRVDEAMPRVEAFLDEAFRAGLPFVRIIHGKGTGTLRRLVRELLHATPLVKHYEFALPGEGGEGVTVAYLDV